MVVEGEGERTTGDNIQRVGHGDIVVVPRTVVHRIKNDGKIDLVFVEVQLGICDEKDIERFEDDYGRVKTSELFPGISKPVQPGIIC